VFEARSVRVSQCFDQVSITELLFHHRALQALQLDRDMLDA
jgi:hypothetical protein